MAKKMTDTTTFQVLEKDAYHAFIEWPLFLMRKLKQLEQYIAAAEENLKGAGQRKEQK
ncbi:MAG: hypothetical protein HY862_13790 [Chloroflexi bacterium]|nr:hypothetical protein [Chloroflexota bacterium]